MVIVLVLGEMAGELLDARRQQRDLHLRRAGIVGATTVLFDDLALLFRGHCHCVSPVESGRPLRATGQGPLPLRNAAAVSVPRGAPTMTSGTFATDRPMEIGLRQQDRRPGRPGCAAAGAIADGAGRAWRARHFIAIVSRLKQLPPARMAGDARGEPRARARRQRHPRGLLLLAAVRRRDQTGLATGVRAQANRFGCTRPSSRISPTPTNCPLGS